MKIEQSTDTAIVVGDIQSNAVGIDIKNMDFIVQLLSTNLYSNPIASFLRESVSNAWDSHKEANTNEAIILDIGTDTEGRDYCRIQDFGVGLSKERFDEIYRFIGSSTKRENNIQIGGYGIGKYASLAYADIVYLTSIYDNIKYKYIMYKDGNKIKIDELGQFNTEESSGLEVMVYLKPGDITKLNTEIFNQLIYFDNLYLSFKNFRSEECKFIADSFNNLKIKKFNNFSVNTEYKSARNNILLGNVMYPLDFNKLPDTSFYIYKYLNISLSFEIGKLEVTPNREELLYSTKNVNLIIDKLRKVAEELNSIAESQIIYNFNDFDSYVNILSDTNARIYVYENYVSFTKNLILSKITYKEKSYDPQIVRTIQRNLDYVDFKPFISFRLINNSITCKSDWRNYRSIYLNNIKFHNIFIANYSDLKSSTIKYIRESPRNITFLKRKKSKDIIKILYNIINDKISNYPGYCAREIKKLFIRQTLETLSNIPKFTDADVPQSFLDDLKAKKAGVKQVRNTNKEEITIGVLEYSSKAQNNLGIISRVEKIVLDKIKHPCIYAEKGNVKLRELFHLFYMAGNDYRKYRFIEIASTKLSLLKNRNNFIHIDKYMDVKYPKIRKLATARYLAIKYPYMKDLGYAANSIKDISINLFNIIMKLNKYIEENSNYSVYSRYKTIGVSIEEELITLCKEHNYFDEEIMGYVQENIMYIEGSRFLALFLHGGQLPSELVNFSTRYILDKKLFRPDLTAVRKLKKETIFNLKEDEDTSNG